METNISVVNPPKIKEITTSNNGTPQKVFPSFGVESFSKNFWYLMKLEMSNVRSLHIGQAGVQTGHAVWDLFLQEQSLSKEPRPQFDSGKESYSTFFDESKSGIVTPRCLMIDSDPFSINNIQRTGIYSEKSFINMKYDTGGIYSRGMNCHQSEDLFFFREIRKIIENCENHQFLVYHSTGGGTGSGLTSALLECLEDFGGQITNIAIYPSLVDASPVEFYNTILCSSKLLEHSNGVLLLDNTALMDNTQINFGTFEPSTDMLNKPIQQLLSSITYSLRFSNDTQITGIEPPMPQMLFHFGSCYPFGLLHASTNSNTIPKIDEFSTNEIAERLYHPHHSTVKMDIKRGIYASSCLLFRGNNIQLTDCRDSVLALHRNKWIRFVDWSPVGLKYRVQKKFENAHSVSSATMIGNSNEISKKFAKYRVKFDTLLSKKSFLHWYQQDGTSEQDLDNAAECVQEAMLCYDELDVDYEDIE